MFGIIPVIVLISVSLSNDVYPYVYIIQKSLYTNVFAIFINDFQLKCF